MQETTRVAYPSCALLSASAPLLAMFIGAPTAIALALTLGVPSHAVASFVALTVATGLGINLGFHRLFSHRSFATIRPIEWGLMVLGSASGQSSPFFWVSMHRKHHQHTDRPGDPHSPHVGAGAASAYWRRAWHAHQGWTWGWARYDPAAVRDLAQRPDLAWIDRHWAAWYLAGLALPAGVGWQVGGTAWDALIGFLWGGCLRQTATQQITYLVNSVGHLWGSQAFDTGEQSRNSLILGLLTFGDGWHNNHHAFPYSARHGFYWWQPDLTWGLIWLMERIGLAWAVKRPKLPAPAPSA